MNKKLLLNIILILVVLTTGCTGNTDPTSETAKVPITVKIATINGPSAMSMLKSIEEKPELGEQVTSEYIIKSNPELIKAMLLHNEADIATIPTTMAAVLYNKNSDYQLAAITVWGTLYLVGTNDNIANWGDLQGKHIYNMGKGMTPDVAFRYMLRKRGLDPEKDVRLDYSFPMPADLANAVAAGKAGLAILSEPTASLVLTKNKNLKIIMNLNEEWNHVESSIPMAQTAVVVKKAFAEKYPDLVEAYLKAYLESTEWVNGNPESAGELAVKHGILPNAKVAAASIPRSNIKFQRVSEIKEGINAYLKLYYDFNPQIVGGKLPDEGFYYQK